MDVGFVIYNFNAYWSLHLRYLFRLKGQCHKMDIFLKGLNILISTFCVCADSFQAFHYPIQLLTFYLLLWNYLLMLKMLTETLLRILSLWLVDVLQCRPVIGCRKKCARINLSPAAFGIILKNHKRLPGCIFSVKIAALGSLKWVTGRIFKISK